MKKVIPVILALFTVGISWGLFRLSDLSEENKYVSMIQPTQTQQLQATAKPTNTDRPTPTATVGYAATADHWRTEANNANIRANNSEGTALALIALNVRATDNETQRVHEREMMTHQINISNNLVELAGIGATASAYPTNVYLEEKKINANFVQEQNQAAKIEADRAIKEKELESQYTLVGSVAYIVVGFAVIALVAVLAFKWRHEQVVDVQDEQEPQGIQPGEGETLLTIKRVDGVITRKILPVTDVMLVEMADTWDLKRSLAYEYFRGADTSWTQDAYVVFRNYALACGLFTIRNEKREVAPSPDGERFFAYLRVKGTTPPFFECIGDLQDSPTVNLPKGVNSDGLRGGEVVQDKTAGNNDFSNGN